MGVSAIHRSLVRTIHSRSQLSQSKQVLGNLLSMNDS